MVGGSVIDVAEVPVQHRAEGAGLSGVDGKGFLSLVGEVCGIVQRPYRDGAGAGDICAVIDLVVHTGRQGLGVAAAAEHHEHFRRDLAAAIGIAGVHSLDHAGGDGRLVDLHHSGAIRILCAVRGDHKVDRVGAGVLEGRLFCAIRRGWSNRIVAHRIICRACDCQVDPVLLAVIGDLLFPDDVLDHVRRFGNRQGIAVGRRVIVVVARQLRGDFRCPAVLQRQQVFICRGKVREIPQGAGVGDRSAVIGQKRFEILQVPAISSSLEGGGSGVRHKNIFRHRLGNDNREGVPVLDIIIGRCRPGDLICAGIRGGGQILFAPARAKRLPVLGDGEGDGHIRRHPPDAHQLMLLAVIGQAADRQHAQAHAACGDVEVIGCVCARLHRIVAVRASGDGGRNGCVARGGGRHDAIRIHLRFGRIPNAVGNGHAIRHCAQIRAAVSDRGVGEDQRVFHRLAHIAVAGGIPIPHRQLRGLDGVGAGHNFNLVVARLFTAVICRDGISALIYRRLVTNELGRNHEAVLIIVVDDARAFTICKSAGIGQLVQGCTIEALLIFQRNGDGPLCHLVGAVGEVEAVIFVFAGANDHIAFAHGGRCGNSLAALGLCHGCKGDVEVINIVPSG